jgi:hypothetical protein
MITDDLTSLFDPAGEDGRVTLRQGELQSWDANTGASTVLVGGALIENVPVLIGETVVLQPGDVVALLTTGDRWFLLGKVTDPGDPGTVPTWPTDIVGLTDDITTINTVAIPAVQADADAAQADATAAAAAAAQAALDAAAAQAAADALQVDLDAAEAAVAAAQAAIDALNTTTLPALQAALDVAEADVAAATADIATLTGTTLPALQTEVDAILPIGSTDISDDAITTPKIATGAITAIKIAANTITAAEIAANAITASELAANAVTAGKIAAGTIVAADIAAGTITATQLAAGAVTAAKIAAGTITATEIAAGTITGTELSASAINGKTITGALIRTMASGMRVQLDSTSGNRIQFYSGVAGETAPGYIQSSSSTLDIKAPVVTGWGQAEINLGGDGGPGGVSRADVIADHVELTTASAGIEVGDTGPTGSPVGPQGVRMTGTIAQFNGVELVRTTDAQTLTNKNLTSGTNTFPSTLATLTGTQTLTNKTLDGVKLGVSGSVFSNLRIGQSANAAINGSGQIIISHGLGVTPLVVVAMGATHYFRLQGQSSTTFTLICRDATTNALVTSGTCTVFWIAII